MISFYDNPDDFKSNEIMCNAWVATAIVGSAVVGAGATIYGANKAAEAQTDAANAGINAQMEQYYRTRKDLAPYRAIGSLAAGDLTSKLDDLTAPIELTQDWLENTPGYKFTREQGLKATQNSAAARGLGVSGAALKGAASFATGLADNTYKTQFDVENTNKTNAYNRLKALVDTGQNAAAQTGTMGQAAATNIGNLSVGAGNAAAAGYNATGGAIAGLANNIGGYAAYKGLYGGGGNSPNYEITGFDGAGNPNYGR